MATSRMQKFTEYKTPTERAQLVRSIAGEVSTAELGETYDYMGLTIKKVKHPEKVREHSAIAVEDPEGTVKDRFNFDLYSTVELVNALDEIRREWAEDRC